MGSKTWILISILAVLTGLAAVAGSCKEVSAENVTGPAAFDYRIGPGDLLEISVWKEPALTKVTTVLPDGRVSFPLIGQIKAEGLTVEMLRQRIEEKLLPFVPDPNLNVAVQQINSLFVYVVGKVHQSGRLELNTHIDVLQALAMAGGLNPFAETDKIKIFRKTGGQTRIFDFDYDAVAEGEGLSQNIRLQRGDVIVVP
jgi:polysaccharide export outer membrane protein